MLPEDHIVESWHDLCLFLGGDITSFTGKLLELVAKADATNKAKLATAFPREVAAWREWVLHNGTLTAAELDHLIRVTP